MNKPVLKYIIPCLLIGIFVHPAHADRTPKFRDFYRQSKHIRSCHHQRSTMQRLEKMDQELARYKNIKPSRELLNELSKFNLTPSILTTLKEAALPRSPEKLVKGILDEECTIKRDDVESALEKLWRVQDRYGDHNLFTTFARQYYSRNFGAVSPHLQVLFDRVGSLRDRDMELRFIRRLQFLSENKVALSKGVFTDKKIFLPKKSFRVRYLSNIGKLTASNFYEDQLVLSIERSMSPNPAEDFPIRHVSGRSVVQIGQGVYPVYGFAAPVGENMASLYTYLMRGDQSNTPLTVVYDKKGQSLALFNKDKTLWLRVSPHEYSEPDNLHLHLNELRSVEFTAKNGAIFNERVNLNLSIPLSTPPGGPIIGTKEYFSNQLVFKPVQALRKLSNITLNERAIY